MASVAIIGAGMAGLTCAQALRGADDSLDITVFEKSRGPGGRMSTRRSDGHQHDHGAPWFAARSPAFQEQIAGWQRAGVVAAWGAGFVGTPRMSALLGHLSAGLRLEAGVRVEVARAIAGEVELFEEGTSRSLGRFGRVVVSTPPAQAVPLLAASPGLAQVAAARSPFVSPCLAALVTFAPRLDLDLDMIEPAGGEVLCRAVREAGKPGRPAEPDAWVLYGHAAWSREHLEGEPDAAARLLLAAFQEQVRGMAGGAVTSLVGHRWRYALAEPADNAPLSLFDPITGLGVCGDWLSAHPSVEGAWRSGRHLAGIMAALS